MGRNSKSPLGTFPYLVTHYLPESKKHEVLLKTSACRPFYVGSLPDLLFSLLDYSKHHFAMAGVQN